MKAREQRSSQGRASGVRANVAFPQKRIYPTNDARHLAEEIKDAATAANRKAEDAATVVSRKAEDVAASVGRKAKDAGDAIKQKLDK